MRGGGGDGDGDPSRILSASSSFCLIVRRRGHASQAHRVVRDDVIVPCWWRRRCAPSRFNAGLAALRAGGVPAEPFRESRTLENVSAGGHRGIRGLDGLHGDGTRQRTGLGVTDHKICDVFG